MKPEGTISSILPHITDRSNKVGKSVAPVLGIDQTCEDALPESIEDMSLLPGKRRRHILDAEFPIEAFNARACP